jgi:hypothetical protein
MLRPVALDGLELLHMHHQAAVAVEQHHGRSGRAAATPMANEMPLPIAPNSRMVRKFSWGRDGICAKNHEQCPPEFTISHSCGKASSSASTDPARVEHPRLDLDGVTVGLRIADARGHRVASPASACGRQRRRQRLDAQARVGSQVMTRHLLAPG